MMLMMAKMMMNTVMMMMMTRIMNALISMLRVEGVRVSPPIIRLRGSYPPTDDEGGDDDEDDGDDDDYGGDDDGYGDDKAMAPGYDYNDEADSDAEVSNEDL